MSKEIAYELWNSTFNSEKGMDAFGIEVRKSAYGDYDSKYGWSIDHVWPLNGQIYNGSEHDDNLQILHITTNIEKGSRLKGKVQGIRFHVNDFYTDESGKKIGQMFILNEDGEWEDVG